MVSFMSKFSWFPHNSFKHPRHAQTTFNICLMKQLQCFSHFDIKSTSTSYARGKVYVRHVQLARTHALKHIFNQYFNKISLWIKIPCFRIRKKKLQRKGANQEHYPSNPGKNSWCFIIIIIIIIYINIIIWLKWLNVIVYQRHYHTITMKQQARAFIYL